jgi:hypothetical protein
VVIGSVLLPLGIGLKGSEMRSRRTNILMNETAQAITTLNMSIK